MPEQRRENNRLAVAKYRAGKGRVKLAARVDTARAFVVEINAQTICAHCGAQPVEWHNPEHVELNRQRFRISTMTSAGKTINAIQAEMARCTPLCRRCHMQEDGRLSVFPFLKRSRKGVKNVRAKLSDDDVRKIRTLRAQGMRPSALARHFGVSHGTIVFLLKGVTWSHVD